jgi:hypothetical protein
MKRRAALSSIHGLQIIYVMHARPDGTIVTQPPSLPVDWVLIDGLQVCHPDWVLLGLLGAQC